MNSHKMNKRNFFNNKIAIIGLGYVGLPLAVAFSKKFEVTGFDKNEERIISLKRNIDRTQEFSKKQIKESKLNFTCDDKKLKDINIFIIAVPTPIYNNKIPDLRNLLAATKTVSRFLKKGDLVIFESTVYPGVTDDICIPILQKNSKLKLNHGFYCAYSPERINPGDKDKKLTNIVKVVSGSNIKTLNFVSSLYSKIIKAGIYKAESIKIAEAAKVIENTQRDLNIAFVNELTTIFSKMSISTYKVLKAASTKWNFLNFYPGLVGGHCIGVDPYYLTYKSIKLKYKPKVILSGRKTNDDMYKFLAKKILNFKIQSKKKIFSLLILGYTFKEDCNDIRNSQIPKLIEYLKKKKISVYFIDPYVSKYSKYEIEKIKKKNLIAFCMRLHIKNLLKTSV